MDYEKTVSTFQACELLGIDYRAFNEWKRGGFVDLDVTANGRGTRTRLKIKELFEIRAFQIIVNAGITRELAHLLVQRSKEQ